MRRRRGGCVASCLRHADQTRRVTIARVRGRATWRGRKPDGRATLRPCRRADRPLTVGDRDTLPDRLLAPCQCACAGDTSHLPPRRNWRPRRLPGTRSRASLPCPHLLAVSRGVHTNVLHLRLAHSSLSANGSRRPDVMAYRWRDGARAWMASKNGSRAGRAMRPRAASELTQSHGRVVASRYASKRAGDPTYASRGRAV